MLPELLLLIFACSTSETEVPEIPPVETAPQVASQDPHVQPKSGSMLASDLAEALSMPADALCIELETLDCFDVHGIALGGVEPYRLGVYEPLEVAPVSAALAADRIALQACERRVAADLDSDPLVIGPVLASDDRAARETVSAAWIDRLLRRDATPKEITVLADLWDEVATTATTRDAAVLTCFVVATSAENLFY